LIDLFIKLSPLIPKTLDLYFSTKIAIGIIFIKCQQSLVGIGTDGGTDNRFFCLNLAARLENDNITISRKNGIPDRILLDDYFFS
jgi:hypothetical protein